MSRAPDLDEVLVRWGERLFYPDNRMVKAASPPELRAGSLGQRAAAVRAQIRATVVRRAPQVMVKVTGGGRGMKAIAAHFRYISRNGSIEVEDERGETLRGRDTVRELAEDWRLGGTLISDIAKPGQPRQAFNIMLSMPHGTDALTVQRAARSFAQIELADHKYVMVLHDHQANPHMHISVRAESMRGRRLNPRKGDLQRWRETFAEQLRDRGVDAEATRNVTRKRHSRDEPLWRIRARQEGRLRVGHPVAQRGTREDIDGLQRSDAWTAIERALAASNDKSDRELARSIGTLLQEMPSRKHSAFLGNTPQLKVAKGSVDVDLGR